MLVFLYEKYMFLYVFLAPKNSTNRIGKPKIDLLNIIWFIISVYEYSRWCLHGVNTAKNKNMNMAT